ncbi:MAG: GNAT family N-acetyltransferase [Rhodospirillales bacterium]|nr:GNAT family N-acetyltransferase [Rhodospirillales bacterium]
MKPGTLSSGFLDQACALQDTVLQDLTRRGQSHFIIPRSRAYFEKHFEPPHAIAGIFDGENLIAQALFHFQEFDMPDYTRMPTLPGQQNGDTFAVIKGALVHPNHQGRGHMGRLVGSFLDWCRENHIRHALSRVEINHAASLYIFEKNGFTVVNTITDARDDAHVHVMHRVI